MTIKSSPRPFQSARGEACFVLADVAASNVPLEVSIESPLRPNAPLGTKRMYAAADRSLVVNVAPYIRALLDPAPLAGKGPMLAPERTAPVRIVVSGAGVVTYTSPYVNLAAGTEDIPVNEILSAGPSSVTVRPTDRDEIALVTSATVQPELVFEYDGLTYVYTGMDDISSKEMIAVSVDVAECILRVAIKAGIHTNFVDRFTVRLSLISGGVTTTLERHYTVARPPQKGTRLAWVNRFGAVDYHTFPMVEKETHRRGEKTLTLVSQMCDGRQAGWLIDILSSPKVWRMADAEAVPIEIVDNMVVVSPVSPTYIALDIKRKR